jgi:CBS domain-containing protein/sporulation protein YlmC with PRC-barrel domain
MTEEKKKIFDKIASLIKEGKIPEGIANIVYEKPGIFVGEVLGNPVMDPSGKKGGTLYDLLIDFKEMFPEVTAVIVKDGKRFFKIEWNDVEMFNRRFVVSKPSIKNWKLYSPSPSDVFIRKHLLDKQIVDINGAKVVRVNDIKLAEIKGKFFVVAAEIGVAGIVRRLSLERIFRLLRIRPSSKLLPWHFFKPLEPSVSRLTLSITNAMLKEMHPADIADIVEDIPEDQRVWFIEHLPSEVIADVLEEIEPIYQAGIIEGLNSEKARDVIANLEPDKAADIISNLSDAAAKKFLSYMDREDAKDVEELLQHPKRRAGGLMTTEYISFPPDMSVGEAIEKFKEQAEEIETVYYIYITEGDILKGVLSLRELLLADRNKKLSEIMTTNIKFCTPDMHYKEIAEIMATYNLIALPVIEDGKLKGIVTVDDILEIVFPPP